MIFAQAILLLAVACTAALGISVYLTNNQRTANKVFFILSASVSAWLGSILQAFTSKGAEEAAVWIRLASIIGAFFPVAFHLLRAAMEQRTASLRELLSQSRWWLVVWGGIVLYCLSPLYLLRAELPDVGIPNAVYGPLSFVFAIYFIGGLVMVTAQVVRDLTSSSGIVRIELQYLLAGLCTFFGNGLFCVIIPPVTHNSQIVSLAPLWVVLMDGVLAYGIATRRILSVGAVLRRAVSYGLLAAYLVSVYGGVWWAVEFIGKELRVTLHFVASAAATLVTALTLSRAQSVLQGVVRRLFINVHQMDLRATLREADLSLSQVQTTPTLLHRFMRMISQAAGTELVTVTLLNAAGSAQVWSTVPDHGVEAESPLVQLMEERRQPLSASLAPRERPTPMLKLATKQLEELGGALALGIYHAHNLHGVVVLGERLSGKLYEVEELDTLQLVINRLAFAVDNARLYTEQKESKNYIETLLNELTSGVIAADAEGLITVCNQEAAKILGTTPKEVVGGALAILPDQLRSPLGNCFAGRMSVRDQSTTFRTAGGTAREVRFSTQHLERGGATGALLVFHDVTELKRLEEQLRHADRLSSLGRMAAGLAHEIRNPLVPIRTFVSLLPECYDDEEFRGSFTRIVGAEVSRIDNLVTQLLSFSKPKPVARVAVPMREVIASSLALMRHDLSKQRIEVSTFFRADWDLVQIDRQQFEQVFLNLFRNAGESMPDGGELTVSLRELPAAAHSSISEQIEILITDQGAGIEPAMLPNLFNPFVTTKESGTGLGLSIVFNIITEHGGTIEIKNRSGKGALVRIQLPLCDRKEQAA